MSGLDIVSVRSFEVRRCYQEVFMGFMERDNYFSNNTIILILVFIFDLKP
jgi:hypothetical protein